MFLLPTDILFIYLYYCRTDSDSSIDNYRYKHTIHSNNIGIPNLRNKKKIFKKENINTIIINIQKQSDPHWQCILCILS